MSRENLLFYGKSLDDMLRARQATIAPRVDAIPRDQFMNANIEEIVQYLVSTLLMEPLVVYEDRAEMEQHETKIDVSRIRDRNPFGDRDPIYVAGVEVIVTVPFSGDPSLWQLQPNHWQTVFPRARVLSPSCDGLGRIEIVIAQPDGEPHEQFKNRFDQEMSTIRFYLESHRKQIEQFNANLQTPIKSAVSSRRDRLQKSEGIKDLLGIPMKRRGDAPAIEPLKIPRKLVRPLPPPPKSGYQAEPGITDEDYKHILSVIRHEGRTFETTPKTYAVHDEEELRDILLAHLNGHYQGDAAGEAFRRSGKTDIRIEDNNRAAFVAECKIWRGSKELSAAVDQLLGYLTWRDCKTALVIFNKKNAKFSEILERVPSVIQTHDKFRRIIQPGSQGEWRFAMTSKEDEARQVIVHVFVFNLYAG